MQIVRFSNFIRWIFALGLYPMQPFVIFLGQVLFVHLFQKFLDVIVVEFACTVMFDVGVYLYDVFCSHMLESSVG